MFKGAGFCLNYNCIHFAKPAFYLGSEETYVCSTCEKPGYLEKNRDSYEGKGLIRTVVTHYKYDVVSREYLFKAIVTDENLPGNCTLHLYRPFIHFDKSALKLAELELAKIATGHSGLVIDFDMDDKAFGEAIAKLARSLQSEYLRADLGSRFTSLGELT